MMTLKLWAWVLLGIFLIIFGLDYAELIVLAQPAGKWIIGGASIIAGIFILLTRFRDRE